MNSKSVQAQPIRVLFVCLGNICRSPMAEAVLRHKVAEAGLSDRIEVDSAGTGDWHVGNPPHPGTRSILSEMGISTTGMYGRQITGDDLSEFDYVLTMDESNLRNVLAMATSGNRAGVRPFMSYAADTGVAEVPDPYHTGGFPEVYRLVNAACDGFLESVRQEHGF
jgi:protein-tyrosine phosphatase